VREDGQSTLASAVTKNQIKSTLFPPVGPTPPVNPTPDANDEALKTAFLAREAAKGL
jgi:hypothetical protein